MNTLPNGKPIDLDMLETAMEDSELGNRYFVMNPMAEARGL